MDLYRPPPPSTALRQHWRSAARSSMVCCASSSSAGASSSPARTSAVSWGPRWGSASHGSHEVAVGGGATGRDAVGRGRKRLPGAGQSSADRGGTAADRGEDGAGG